jgi:hypothetical protein
MLDILSESLKLIGGVAAIGAAASAFAYAVFRIFATRWIETRFSERLEEFKHQQNQEIEHVRFRINTMMDRNVKLHQREFDVLPDTWSLLSEAFYAVEPVALGVQRNPDLDKMSAERLDEFLETSPLTALQKAELKAASDKKKYYGEVKAWHDLDKAIDAYNEFHTKFAKNGIFIMEPLKTKFAEVDDMLKEAIIERQVQPHKFDKGVALNSRGRALLKALGRQLQPADRQRRTRPGQRNRIAPLLSLRNPAGRLSASSISIPTFCGTTNNRGDRSRSPGGSLVRRRSGEARRRALGPRRRQRHCRLLA